MQIMSDKGLLTRDETDRSHVYRPTVQRDEVQQQMASTLMDRAFGGSAYRLLVGALGGRRTSRKELANLRCSDVGSACSYLRVEANIPTE